MQAKIERLRVDPDRLWRSLMDMGRIGALPFGGCRRLALSAEDREARDLFVKWCREAGCAVSFDAIGNIFACRAGTKTGLPAVATGSHLDTQPHGGKFDGVYGVLAGLEVIRTLNDAGIATCAPIAVAVWTNEEGARFPPPLTGSSSFAGSLELEGVHSRVIADDGQTVKESLRKLGYLGKDRPGGLQIDCFIEAHIEQGPILERNGVMIGVVTQVQGIRWLEVSVEGQDAHAGTSPMEGRRDALVAAAHMVVRLDGLTRGEDESTRLTVGRLTVSPNSGSTIPGAVRFNIDVRHPRVDALEQLESAIRRVVAEIASTRNVSATVSSSLQVPPVFFDPGVVEVIRAAAASLGYSHRDIMSGAGHDAMNIARRTPSGMVFIPCRDGLSHNELEYASPEHTAAGANVLLHAVLARARTAER